MPVVILISILAIGCQTEDKKGLADPECISTRSDWISGAERYRVSLIEARAPYGVRWTNAQYEDKFSQVFNDDLGGDEYIRY